MSRRGLEWTIAGLLLLPALMGFTFPGSWSRLWRQADQAFRRQQYEEAARLYEQARQIQPDDWRLLFNQAVALAAAKKTEEAAALFEKIAANGPPELREAAEYNAGNCYLAQQQNEKAIEHYKRALYLKPDDFNAKWNLELAKRQQKQQQQQQQQQQKQPQGSPQKRPQASPPQRCPQPKPTQQAPQQTAAERRMDKEEARRLLQALSQADRETLKRLAKQRWQPFRETRPAKDW